MLTCTCFACPCPCHVFITDGPSGGEGREPPGTHGAWRWPGLSPGSGLAETATGPGSILTARRGADSLGLQRLAFYGVLKASAFRQCRALRTTPSIVFPLARASLPKSTVRRQFPTAGPVRGPEDASQLFLSRGAPRVAFDEKKKSPGKFSKSPTRRPPRSLHDLLNLESAPDASQGQPIQSAQRFKQLQKLFNDESK